MAWKINKTRGPWETESRSERRFKRGGYRPLMVEVEPLRIVYRPKGTQQRVSITHEKVYQLACLAHAEANRTTKRRTVTRGRLRKG